MPELKIDRRSTEFDILPIGEGGPVFTFRYLSVEKFSEVAAAYDQVAETQDTKGALRLFITVLRTGLKVWKNLKSDDPETLKAFELTGDGEQELPYKPDLIRHAVYLRDLRSLAVAFMEEQSPTTKTLGN